MAGDTCHQNDPTKERDDDCGLRCDCGCLLARLVKGGVEIKCRRCKTTHVVPLTPELFDDDP